MRISNIGQNYQDYKPSFNAKLVVKDDAFRLIKNETYTNFKSVMDSFRKKLASDPINPEDTVIVSTIKHDSPVKTFSGDQNANLKVAIDDCSSNFYYDSKRYNSQLAEDLYNTYKHVRYLRHYSHQ